MSADTQRRKVRHREGYVAMVMNDFGKQSSLRLRGQSFYPVVHNRDLEDISEDDFVREFGKYK